VRGFFGAKQATRDFGGKSIRSCGLT
jgi:hypothetical protein